MKVTQQLHDLGQSLWLDTITRGLLTNGTLARYIAGLSITRLTTHPTIFALAIRSTDFYDEAVRQKTGHGKSAEGEINFTALAGGLSGKESFASSWGELLACIRAKGAAMSSEKMYAT